MTHYFDHNAHAPLDPRVLEYMLPFYTHQGHLDSSHQCSRMMKPILEEASHHIRTLAGSRYGQVLWTSSGSEANNWAIRGIKPISNFSTQNDDFLFYYAPHSHASILKTLEHVLPYASTPIPINEQGLLDLPLHAQYVSFPWAHHETGVIQDHLEDSFAQKRSYVHIDAVQAAGKTPLRFDAWSVHAMSIASYKINGPSGIGALILHADQCIEPLIYGHALRAGSLSLPHIAGFGRAAYFAIQEFEKRFEHTQKLKNQFEACLRNLEPGVLIFSEKASRLSNTSFFSIPNVHSASVLLQLDHMGFCLSGGSACAQGMPSPALIAMGIDSDAISGAFRVSFGFQNTAHEVTLLLQAFQQCLSRKTI